MSQRHDSKLHLTLFYNVLYMFAIDPTKPKSRRFPTWLKLESAQVMALGRQSQRCGTQVVGFAVDLHDPFLQPPGMGLGLDVSDLMAS